MSTARCEVCGQTDRISRCSGCRAVYYCGRDHQATDRPSHKKGCDAVRHARGVFEREARAVRDSAAEDDDNAFDTRPYISAQFLFADALLRNFGAVEPRMEAVGAALNHLVDLLAAARADPFYLRNVIPALYATLGMDQHAYDFMKWWAGKSAEELLEVDWNDPSVPYLDVRDADVLEPLPDAWVKAPSWKLELSHPVIVMLLKMRVLLDLVDMQNARRFLRGRLPPEIVDMIQSELASGIVASRRELIRGSVEKTSEHIMALKGQIEQLWKDTNESSPILWKKMFMGFKDPAFAIAKRPMGFTDEPHDEARYVVGNTLPAWLVDQERVSVMEKILETIDRKFSTVAG